MNLSQRQHNAFIAIALLIAVIALNVLRCPELLIQPRFYAEEGTLFFHHAVLNSFWANVFTAHCGYYTLFYQLATSCAALAPLEWAPLVTTWISLFVQVGVSAYVLWEKLPYLRSWLRRALLAFAIPLLAWPETWLTIIGAQYWFSVLTFFILIAAEVPQESFRHRLRCGLLVITGLTGVISCMMTPVFLLRALQEKSRIYWEYCLIIAGCSLVQGSVFLYALSHRPEELASRFAHNPLKDILFKSLIYLFAVPFAGRGSFENEAVVRAMSSLITRYEELTGTLSSLNPLFLTPFLVGVFIVLVLITLVISGISRPGTLLIILALILVTSLSVLLSVNSSGGPRYFFLPSLMIITFFLGVPEMRLSKVAASLAMLLVCISLVANGREYRAMMSQRAYNPGYPVWQEELAAWRLDPGYELKIWPPPWKMTLPRM